MRQFIFHGFPDLFQFIFGLLFNLLLSIDQIFRLMFLKIVELFDILIKLILK